jgi:hypothetical protein
MMTNNQVNSNNSHYDTSEYKTCSGLNCSNQPTSILKVKYVNKTGHFCQRCTTDLLQLELAEEIPKEEILNA